MGYNTLKTKILTELTASDQSNHLIAMSFAVGLFVTLSPFWGAQNIIAISLAVLFRLNKVIVMITANLSSIPPLIPIIVLMAYQTGSVLMTGEFTDHIPELDELRELKGHFILYFVGAVVSGAFLSVLMFIVILVTLGMTRNKLSNQ
ncbi:MAG: hypothetical protein COB51_13035 [Moraxellaceae bacterium]|nr:MAG: hypothetical protein COB51_13035 [Moraxellaceae bacterium]